MIQIYLGKINQAIFLENFIIEDFIIIIYFKQR